MNRLPLGEANFEKLREKNKIYVDKTKEIYEMIEYSDYLFLSRPRRFGKSLIVSTLEALYLGEKELFKGLWIEDKWDWEVHPVIRLDFSTLTQSRTIEDFDDSLMVLLNRYAAEYKIKIKGTSVPTRLSSILAGLYNSTEKRVVILIDEYDKPITNHISNVEKAEQYRTYLRDIYETIKAENKYIHLLFITGISKFVKMSIFSVINQLKDISLIPEFNNIVGFTEQEIRDNFAEYLVELSEIEELNVEELMEEIRARYNGYSWDGEQKVYNPFAIINALSDMEIHDYWFETGTPNFLVKLIKEKYAQHYHQPPVITEFENVQAVKRTFDSYDLEHIDLTALLFQTGYLTVKEKLGRGSKAIYTLGYPNLEVRTALNGYLLRAFIQSDISTHIETKAVLLLRTLETKDESQFLVLLRSIFAGLPYSILKHANEYYYQSLFYQLLSLLGVKDIFLEVAGYKGRVDGVLALKDALFVFEFKFARTGTMKTLLNKAVTQVTDRGYLHPFLGTKRSIYRIVIGFLYKKSAKDKNPILTINSQWKLVEK